MERGGAPATERFNFSCWDFRVSIGRDLWSSVLIAQVKGDQRVELRGHYQILKFHAEPAGAHARPWPVCQRGNAHLIEAVEIAPHAGCGNRRGVRLGAQESPVGARNRSLQRYDLGGI